MSNLIIFEQGSQPVEVRLEGETVWGSEKYLKQLVGKMQQDFH